MAFTTDFVMGAGGSVEEIPVSMSGGGNGTVYPLTTIDAGSGAIILLLGTLTTNQSSASYVPHLRIGALTHQDPRLYLTGPTATGIGVRAEGEVQISILSRVSSTTTFSGTVYVARL